MSATFAGQTAVVSGGTRGIGAAVTRALLTAGARVHATYRGSDERAQAFAEALGPERERLSLHRFDVADAEAVSAFWAGLEGGVELLVSNAGIRRDAVLGAMPLADWSAVLDTNLTGTFLMCKHAVQAMLRARYGRIVIITSPAGRHGFAGQANYAASKAGQVGLMRSLAREVGKRGITVNCVSPGFVETDLLADLAPEVREAHARKVPLGRFARPEEIAYAVLALLAREASYVHGAVLEVSGGL